MVNSTHAAISLVAMELLTNVTVSQTELENAQQVNCQPLSPSPSPSTSHPQCPTLFLPPFSPHTLQMFNSADSALDSANLTALGALHATTQRSTILTDIEQSASANAEQLAALNTSIDTLMAQLQEAMQAAASVRLHLLPVFAYSISLPLSIIFSLTHSPPPLSKLSHSSLSFSPFFF